jgi:hypothetical protein
MALRENALNSSLPARPSRSMRFLMLTVTGIALAAAGAAFGGGKPSNRNLRTAPIEVTAHPIKSFDHADPDKKHFGKLTWLGGMVLTSPAPNFGGWSSLVLGPAGKSFLSISDAGAWMSGKIVYDKEGRPVGMRSVLLGPLQADSGNASKRDRDAEGLALVDGTPEHGQLLVSFERKHRIGRYEIAPQGLSAPRGYVKLPAAITGRLQSNHGIEAIAVLRGANKGSLVAFAEQAHDEQDDHVGWIWTNGSPAPFYLSNPGDFDVSDATCLPDGGLLVLERRFRWNEGVKIRLRLIKAPELRAGAHVEGETLLSADMGQEIDNMEGVATHVAPGGAVIVTLISDDNFNKVLQRTVLLQFAIDRADLASARQSR